MLAPRITPSREAELLVAILDRVEATKNEAMKQTRLLERIAKVLESGRKV